MAMQILKFIEIHVYKQLIHVMGNQVNVSVHIAY